MPVDHETMLPLCDYYNSDHPLITSQSIWSLTLLAMPSSHCRSCFHAPSTILAMPLLHYRAPNCTSVLPFQASLLPSPHPVLHFRQPVYCIHYYLSKSLQNSLKNSLNFFENCNKVLLHSKLYRISSSTSSKFLVIMQQNKI